VKEVIIGMMLDQQEDFWRSGSMM